MGKSTAKRSKKSNDPADHVEVDAKEVETEPAESANGVANVPNSASESSASGLVAMVIGATGATGRFVVQELLASEHWSKVIVIARRSGAGTYYEESAKLVEIVGSLDGMCNSSHAAFQAVKQYEPHAAFCCLGTTMDVAKTKANFKRVDYTYATDFAFLARTHRVASYSLVSSTGASSSSSIFYLRTKGKTEDYTKALGFPLLKIFRPGLLGRPDPTSAESCYSHIQTPLRVQFLAKILVTAARLDLEAHPQIFQKETAVAVFASAVPLVKQSWDNKKIYKFAKINGIPKRGDDDS